MATTPARWGSEFSISFGSQTGNQLSSSIVATVDGGYLVSWTDTGFPESRIATRTGDFTPQGNSYVVLNGSIVTLSAATAGQDLYASALTRLNNGSVVLSAITGNDGDGSNFGAFGTATVATLNSVTAVPTSANETPITNIPGLLNEVNRTDIAALTGGGYSLAVSGGTASTDSGIYVRTLTAAGAVVADFIKTDDPAVNQFEVGPTIASLSDGGFFVTWINGGLLGLADNKLQGQRFSALGVKAGGIIDIGLGATNVVASARLNNGNVVVAFTDSASTTEAFNGEENITYRIMTPAGTFVTGELLASTASAGQQIRPDVAALQDGGFVIVWQDSGANGADTEGTAIRGQRFNAAGTKIGAQFLVNTTTAGDQTDPSVGVLSDGRFMVTWTDASDVAGTIIRTQIFDPREGLVNGTLFGEQVMGSNLLNDRINGLAGNDTIMGLGGNDNINGGTGADRMFGGLGNDTFHVDNAGDVIVEFANSGTDVMIVSLAARYAMPVNVESAFITSPTGGWISANEAANVLTGSNANDIFFGNGGNDTIRGGLGSDILFGGAGNDALHGGGSTLGDAGSDVLNGGLGQDNLIGSGGNDIFDFNSRLDSPAQPRQISFPGPAGGFPSFVASGALDVIVDFARGDKIDLSGIDPRTGALELRWLAGNDIRPMTAFNPPTGYAVNFKIFNGDLNFIGDEITIISADTTGDGVIDFGIQVIGRHEFFRSDFIL